LAGGHRQEFIVPATSHEVQWGKIEAWLQSAGKPNEQGMKGRLRELLRM